MTDAPERIWAMRPSIGEYLADPPVTPEDNLYLTEYIRADLHDAIVKAADELAEAIMGMTFSDNAIAAKAAIDAYRKARGESK